MNPTLQDDPASQNGASPAKQFVKKSYHTGICVTEKKGIAIIKQSKKNEFHWLEKFVQRPRERIFLRALSASLVPEASRSRGRPGVPLLAPLLLPTIGPIVADPGEL